MGDSKPENQPGPMDGEDLANLVNERRKHHRVDLPLRARYLTEAGEEQTGVVLNISAGGAMVRAKFPPAFGQNVVLYIDQVGRIEGKVVRSGNNCFAVSYPKRRKKQAKIADDLTSILNNRRRGADRRQNPRIRHDTPASVHLEDGRELECSILDISLTGASIEVSPRPPLGTHLILGRMTAKVVRRHEKGVGIVFTGGAERMDEVVEKTASEEPFAPSGPGFAQPFGKKGF
ncbi:PilZ domain-containing protein [Hyphococcus luteus]|uniref:PilZ domain-containing protein n=1 Tax=Hyphococcus luteus TaxID=2058213 RepID=A0A2S7K8V0_9PROT|nr:PilZ domain-containing protein [Marinicaulis flavus]PQA88922.1 hypothetical protein CW354_02935 [Marinicaulis flavus]